MPAEATPVAAAMLLGATPMAIDARGVPRMLQGRDVAPAPAANAMASARVLIARLAPAWGVRGALPELRALGEVPAPGGRIARLAQVIDGLHVDGGELRVLVGPGGQLIAASGALIGADAPRTAAVFAHDDVTAIARAVAYTRGGAFDGAALATKWNKLDGSRVVAGASGGTDVQLAQAKQAWVHIGGTLVAAWIVEAYTSPATSTDGELHRTVVSADGRRVLDQRSLTQDAAFNYRVFAETTGELHPFDGPTVDATPHPTGAPDGSFPAYVTPELVEIEGLNHNADGVADPWLASNRTETIGNNVEAYTDFNAPSGLSFGDFRATTTSQRTFDRSFDTAIGPLSSQDQQMAGITSLFYNINWLHDFWYDAGFTEVAGNGQDNNYGRGGQDRDAILAEAQDNALGGSRNNANMSTPSDGLPPRMQVFLWSGTEDLALAVGTQTPTTRAAGFSPGSYDITADVLLADDATGTTTDGCEPLSAGAVPGKIVLVDRGSCTFKRKALNIQNAGGVGMILVNNQAGTTPPSLGDDATITTPITIGVMSVTMADGDTVKTELLAGTVSATLHRVSGPELEGAIDSTLIAHEYGHYLHHRLSLCGTTMCGAMSEGWGDFSSLMLLARDGDNLDGAYPFSIYTTQSFSSDAGYFGIRRAPYSTNPAINALSFRHMANGEALPMDHPFLPFGSNAEVHNAGEVWAQVMWEAYVALQKAGTSFTETRAKMAKYVVGGLLMAPPDASPTEMRDAMLAVMHAASPADHDVVAAAFARRGFGSCAISPGADSTDFVGIVESTEVAGRAVVGAETSEATASCDDDSVLDSGETLRVTVPIANRGHLALTDLTATLTSTTPGVTVTSAPVQIATLEPYATSQVIAEIKLEGELVDPLAGELTLSIAGTGGCEDVTTQAFSLRMNVDDVAEASATDTFDTAASVWTIDGDGAAVWSHARVTALDGVWHGDDIGTNSDTSIVSPVVSVGADPFIVTFTHKHSFEVGGNGAAFDGGVIEYSTDAGATWKDIAEIVATTGYTDMLDAGNPLGARMAYTGTNLAFPDTDVQALDFGTALAGMQVQIRFRIGTDSGVGDEGWQINDVAMSGIIGTPFPSQVADAGVCGTTEPPGDTDDGGCCDAGPLGATNVGVSFAVLALVLRRRRRR